MADPVELCFLSLLSIIIIMAVISMKMSRLNFVLLFIFTYYFILTHFNNHLGESILSSLKLAMLLGSDVAQPTRIISMPVKVCSHIYAACRYIHIICTILVHQTFQN